MTFIKSMFFALLFVFGSGYVSASAGSGSEEVLIARVNEFHPFSFQENGEWQGIHIESYRALAKEANIKIEFRNIPWSRAMKDLTNKPIMIAQLTPTPERKKIMHFIGPHDREEMIIGMSKEHLNYEIKKLDDLAALCRITGRKIVYQQDVFYSKEFNERIEGDSEFSKYFERRVSYDTVMKMVEMGRILGFLEEKPALLYRIKNKHSSDSVAIHPYVLSSSDVYFGVSKTVSDSIVRKLYEANERLLSNGTYKKILNNW